MTPVITLRMLLDLINAPHTIHVYMLDVEAEEVSVESPVHYYDDLLLIETTRSGKPKLRVPEHFMGARVLCQFPMNGSLVVHVENSKQYKSISTDKSGGTNDAYTCTEKAVPNE